MNGLIKWGLWQKRWFTFWWCFAVLAFVFIALVFYPPFRDQASQLDQTFAQIPEGARALLSDTQDFLSPIGYLSSQIYYLMLPMLLGILAIVLGSSLIAREEKEGTIELLLSRPVARGNLLAAKAFIGVAITFAAALSSLVLAIVMVKLVKLPVGNIDLAMATLSCLLLALSFGAIAFLITMLGKARVASVGIATLVALGGYIISSLAAVATWLKWPSKLFPFHYYEPAELLTGNYRWQSFAVFGGILIVSGVLSYILFRRRDVAV